MKRALLVGLTLIAVAAATTYVFQLTQKADIYYYQGHDLFVKAKYKASIPFFVQSLSHDPKRVKTLSELGYAYLWSGNQQDAIKVFQQLLVLEPENMRVRKSLASAYSWSKEYAKAEDLFLDVIRASEKDREAQKELAEIYIWDNKFDKSKEILTALLQSNPGDVRAKYLYGKALLYSGQTQEALKIFQELSGDSKQSPGKTS
jgi:lipopolysaccharide biosynthesis regulator YciM